MQTGGGVVQCDHAPAVLVDKNVTIFLGKFS